MSVVAAAVVNKSRGKVPRILRCLTCECGVLHGLMRNPLMKRFGSNGGAS